MNIYNCLQNCTKSYLHLDNILQMSHSYGFSLVYFIYNVLGGITYHNMIHITNTRKKPYERKSARRNTATTLKFHDAIKFYMLHPSEKPYECDI